ncbi:MAG: hypothetical protein QM750_08695 [Rubrivivax sp.]
MNPVILPAIRASAVPAAFALPERSADGAAALAALLIPLPGVRFAAGLRAARP